MTTIVAADIFATFGDLPLHPLVVHFAVVILPLSALGLIAIIVIPKWRAALGWLVLAGLAVGAVAAFIAKQSGEALAGYVGLPQEHADYGDVLPLVAVLLFLCAVAWFFVTRKQTGRSVVGIILAIASIALAIAATILTIVVGHTGAQAAWGGRLAASTAAPSQSQSTSANTAQASTGYTLADVAQHSDPSDCWTAVNGNVYDVTAWIDQHPGGSKVIMGMCGRDASQSFDGQHQGQPRPEQELANFLLGPLQN